MAKLPELLNGSQQNLVSNHRVHPVNHFEISFPYLLSDEGLLQGLRLRPHNQDPALGLEVGSGRRQRRQGGTYRRVNAKGFGKKFLVTL